MQFTEEQRQVRLERSRKWSKEHHEKYRDWAQQRREKNPQAAKAKAQKHYAKVKDEPEYKARKRKNQQDLSQRRREAVRTVAMHYGCQNPGCQSKEFMPEELDFHHVEKKEFSVSQKLGKSLPTLAAEINKCVVLCANCHRRFHAGRFSIVGLKRCDVDDVLKPREVE